MSRGREKEPPEHLGRVLHGLGEAADLFGQVVADRLGLARSDLQVVGLLEGRGPQTAGQLAEGTGLTTGAVTGVIDRLERAGYVRRDPDPGDRRRVIVKLLPDRLGALSRLWEPVVRALHELEAGLTPAQRAVVAQAVGKAAASFREEALRLRGSGRAAGPGAAEPGEAAAPLAGLARGRLEFSSGAARVQLAAGAPEGELFRATFEGKPPKVTVREGTVQVAWKAFGPFGWGKSQARFALSAEVPWDVDARGGVARLDADLAGLRLASFAIRGGAHAVDVRLPAPRGTVLVRISGGASTVAFRRPAGTAARLRITGGVAALAFDAQRLGAVGGTVLLESPDFARAEDRYDFELTGGAAGLDVGTGEPAR